MENLKNGGIPNSQLTASPPQSPGHHCPTPSAPHQTSINWSSVPNKIIRKGPMLQSSSDFEENISSFMLQSIKQTWTWLSSRSFHSVCKEGFSMYVVYRYNQHEFNGTVNCDDCFDPIPHQSVSKTKKFETRGVFDKSTYWLNMT